MLIASKKNIFLNFNLHVSFAAYAPYPSPLKEKTKCANRALELGNVPESFDIVKAQIAKNNFKLYLLQ